MRRRTAQATSADDWTGLLDSASPTQLVRLMDPKPADEQHPYLQTPDTINFDVYGSHSVEALPPKAFEIGRTMQDEIVRQQIDFAGVGPPTPAQPRTPATPMSAPSSSSKRPVDSSYQLLPRELNDMLPKRVGEEPAPTVDKSVLPPGTDHRQLVDSIMAAVRYHHKLGRPHLQPAPAGLLGEDAEPEAFWSAADAKLNRLATQADGCDVRKRRAPDKPQLPDLERVETVEETRRRKSA